MVGYILGERWTEPAIAEMDGGLRMEDLVSARLEFSQTYITIWTLAELREWWTDLLDWAGLSDDDRAEAERRFMQRVHAG